ncbi:PREDICTED: uncharacterized protein LOC109205168 [Nicotiana attenuata]|uniref:uncharacterized protein LOC109205168 n=1 Tax=Nicotiana attenuata TaxID=49451 RepID=UPI000905D218|nr:PREDICTED: uncharacterized protein LOC109205168 [Nicotiana attenuata]
MVAVVSGTIKDVEEKQQLKRSVEENMLSTSTSDKGDKTDMDPRTALKSQVLADFSSILLPRDENEVRASTRSNLGTSTLYTDGSSNIKGASLGVVLISPSGKIIRQTIKYYPITNNEAKYEAMVVGLELAKEMGIEQIEIKSDSQLVVNQMQGNYVAREAMQQYLEKV